MLFNKNRGFTLIELLVVIAVIGLLSSIVLVSLQGARARARDAKRAQELKALQKVLEIYWVGEGKYPYWTGPGSDEGVCVEASENFKTTLAYLLTLPGDPLYDSSKCSSPFNEECYCYIYKTSGEQRYKLFAKMEKSPELAQRDGGIYDEFYEVYSVMSEEDSSQIVFGGGSEEGYYVGGGKWIKLSIENQTSIYKYNGHPSHYLGWSLYVDQEIWKVDRDTGAKIEQIIYPNNEGETDFKIVRCQNDGNFTGCAPITIGNRGTCTDGVVKNYGDLEPASWTTYYDNNYRDCDTGNPQVIYSLDPWDHTSGKKTRVQFQNLGLSDYGKHQLCVKYHHFQTEMTTERCLEFITEWIDMDLTGDSGGNKTFGDTISWTTNPRTRYDNQPVLSSYLEKRCYIYSWSWIHYPNNDSGPSATLVRHSTWDNYWGYLGVLFGIKNDQPAGDRAVTATVKFPNSCYLRDRDGSNDYSFYHHNCGWYHGVNGLDKTVYCCGSSWSDTDTGLCDKFVVSGQYGGTLIITAHIDAKGDNYDDTRIYIECPGATAFGNAADPYTVDVSGVNYFWVNDMDYSTEKSLSEALPDSRYVANTDDFSCSNLKLNLCGKAYTYIELYNLYDVYGNKYTSPSSICVSGPQCPHAICP